MLLQKNAKNTLDRKFKQRGRKRKMEAKRRFVLRIKMRQLKIQGDILSKLVFEKLTHTGHTEDKRGRGKLT